MNFGRFIRRGPVTSLADTYGYHTETKRDFEFTGIQMGRWLMFGFLHAKPQGDSPQRRFPIDTKPSFEADYSPQQDDPIYLATPSVPSR